MKKLFSLLLFLSLSLLLQNKPLRAQGLDSLFGVWNDVSQTDSIRLNALGTIARNGFLFSKPDSAFYYAQMQYDFASKSGIKIEMANALNTQAGSFYVRGNNAKALDYLNRSLVISKKIGDKKGLTKSIGNVGLIYAAQDNYPKALGYYLQSLKIWEEIGDKKGIATTLNNIGNIYQEQSDFPKALDYYHRSLENQEAIGDTKGISASLNNIGTIYQEQGKYAEAINNFERSINIQEKIGNQKGIASALSNLGNIYGEKGELTEALEYYRKSLHIREAIGDKKGMAISYNGLGITFNRREEYSNGLIECLKGLELAEEVGAFLDQKFACQCLYDAYKALNQGNEALVYLEKMQIITDSLNSEETSKNLQQMEFAKQVYQDSVVTAEKERLIDEAHKEEVQKQNKTRNILAIGGGVILLLAGTIYSRLRFVRKSKASLQVEKDLSENLLLNILPADIAAELKEKGRADARDFDRVSILFTDFKGFTAASEKLSAKELVSEINACFEAFDGIMDKYKVEKIKTIGDAYMAAGGLPIPSDDSVKNTVMAALEMQDFIIKRKKEMDIKGLPAFEMRVGIHTGPVVAGIVGVKKFAYDIWGDTVNTASRMESSGGVGKVNLSQATYNELKDDSDLAFESRGKIQAKGKGEIEMYFVELKA